jgi:hypothetical protein
MPSLILGGAAAAESEIKFLSTDVQTRQVISACRLSFEVCCWSDMLGRPELRLLTVAHCRSETLGMMTSPSMRSTPYTPHPSPDQVALHLRHLLTTLENMSSSYVDIWMVSSPEGEYKRGGVSGLDSMLLLLLLSDEEYGTCV